jgi:hypothetical protein
MVRACSRELFFFGGVRFPVCNNMRKVLKVAHALAWGRLCYRLYYLVFTQEGSCSIGHRRPAGEPRPSKTYSYLASLWMQQQGRESTHLPDWNATLKNNNSRVRVSWAGQGKGNPSIIVLICAVHYIRRPHLYPYGTCASCCNESVCKSSCIAQMVDLRSFLEEESSFSCCIILLTHQRKIADLLLSNMQRTC